MGLAVVKGKHREAHDRCREPRDGIEPWGPGATADAPPRAVMASPSLPARRTKMAKADVKRSVDSAKAPGLQAKLGCP